MLILILSILAVGLLACWGIYAYLDRSKTVSVKSIENLNGELFLIHLTKPEHLVWESGSYAKFTLTDSKESRWLTIASTPVENEILLLTYNSGSTYKKVLTSLHKGAKIQMSWLTSTLKVNEDASPLVCFASDVGIAAIHPIITEWAGKREIVLSHLDKGVMAFDSEFVELAANQELLTYQTSAGFSQSKEQLAQAIDYYGPKATYLLAGQPDDVEAMKAFLSSKGIDSSRIQVEMFRGLP
ncbi:ferredoxin reductase [Streptococcus sp.]|uniref:ferredoxin reductase n=1 Tax=Streptococcus sp. TaxID=1306 RepID=UPI00359F3DFF